MAEGTTYINLLLQETTLTPSFLKNNLKYINESRVFQTSTDNTKLKNLISTINSKLNLSGGDRSKALLVLESILLQCPADLYNDNAVGWMVLSSKLNQNTIEVELRVLHLLIEKSICNPDMKKNIATNIIPRFAEKIGSPDKTKSVQIVINMLRCLRSFINCYSSSCGPHRVNEGTFQKYVSYCLKEYKSVPRIIHEAAACFVALCECGTKGQQGINFKEAWSCKLKQLINTCHKLFDSIYSNVDFVALTAVEQNEDVLHDLLDVNLDTDITPLKRYHQMKEKFTVLAELLQAMFLCKYSKSKCFLPNDVLNLACRVLSVTGPVLEKCVQTNDILALAAILGELHERAFDVLQALITCGRRNLIPQASLICKLCLQSLKWTYWKEWIYGCRKPFESLRCKVYSVLSSWMSVASSCSFIEMFADELIPIIIADIEFEKPSVKLTVTTANSKRNKRKRSHPVTEMNVQSDSPLFVDRTANASVCAGAHETLQLLLRSASVLIKWEHHKNLQYVILPLLVEMLESISVDNYPLPYSEGRCRMQLFGSLLSLVQEPHPKWIAPMSLAIRFFSMGVNDKCPTVASFCRTALGQLESTIHPRCPTLYVSYTNGEQTETRRSEWISEEVLSSNTTEQVESRERQETTTQVEKSVEAEVPSCSQSTVMSVTKETTMESEDELSVEQRTGLGDELPVETRIDRLSSEVGSSTTVEGMPSIKSRVASSRTPLRSTSEPCAKKLKVTSTKEVEEDEKVKAMLSDFVDTLE